MVGGTGGMCGGGCGVLRKRYSDEPDVCGAEGFDHHEEYCCNCLKHQFKWRYYDDDACKQCKRREAA
eukprot:gene15619-17928_t